MVLDRLGAVPADTLFVDDTPAIVDAARLLGLRVHLHTDTTETAEVIRSFHQPVTG